MKTPLEELACLYVLDQLEEQKRAEFEERLLRDPAAVGLVREAEAGLARRIHELPPREPPVGLLGRIEQRLDQRTTGAPPAHARGIAPWAAIARWGLAAAIVVGLGAIAIQLWQRNRAATDRPVVIVVGLDQGRNALAELPLAGSPASADARFIQLASLAERYWDKPGDLPVKMNSPGAGGRGYALFDPGSNQGFIAVQQLPAVEPGQRYHLWILDAASGQVREAGVLPLAGSSRGLYFFSVAPAAGPKSGRLDFLVTVENAAEPDATRPRGRVVLGDRGI